MKNARQEKILELIRINNFDTQEALQKQLEDEGFAVTQATISRDIRELGIIKSEGDDKVYKYRISHSKDRTVADNYILILRQSTANASYANNLVVVKTYSGMGSAAGAALDNMKLENVLGTLAGDDTVLVVASDEAAAAALCEKLNNYLGD